MGIFRRFSDRWRRIGAQPGNHRLNRYGARMNDNDGSQMTGG
jgi:hypothetical protein